MATQYTAGIVQGQKWTAAIANQIGAAWEDWTPTYTSDAGSLTTTTTVFARYAVIQKIFMFRGAVIINNAGTASGAFYVSLPTAYNTPQNTTGDTAIGVGREYQVTGNVLAVRYSVNKIGISNYNNTTAIATNNRLSYAGMFELA